MLTYFIFIFCYYLSDYIYFISFLFVCICPQLFWRDSIFPFKELYKFISEVEMWCFRSHRNVVCETINITMYLLKGMSFDSLVYRILKQCSWRFTSQLEVLVMGCFRSRELPRILILDPITLFLIFLLFFESHWFSCLCGCRCCWALSDGNYVEAYCCHAVVVQYPFCHKCH